MNIPSARKFHKKMKFFCVRIFHLTNIPHIIEKQVDDEGENKFPSPEKRWGFCIVAASEFHSPPQDFNKVKVTPAITGRVFVRHGR